MSTNNHQPIAVKVLRWGLFALAFMPLVIFSDFLSPFHFGKVILFRVVVEVLGVIYIGLVIRDRRWLPPRTRLFWALTAFTAAFGLATLTSVNVYNSFWGSLERMGGWFSWLHFWLSFVMLTAIFRRREDWEKFLQLSVLAGLLSIIYGFLQKSELRGIIGSGGRNKIFGTLGNPALYAGYILVLTMLSLLVSFLPETGFSRRLKLWQGGAVVLLGTVILWLPSISDWAITYWLIFLGAGGALAWLVSGAFWRWGYRVFFILGFLSVLLAGVRGSAIAVVVGVAFFGWLYAASHERLARPVRRLTMAFVAAAAVLLISLLALRDADFVKENSYLSRYADFSPNSYTVKTRFWAWRAGFDGLNDSFKEMVLGAGPENFNVPFARHFNPQFFRGIGSETLFDRAHNQFLEVLFTMGLLGFAAYLSIFWFAVKALRAKTAPIGWDKGEVAVWRSGLLSALAAYSIHNLFIFDTAANYLMFLLLLGLTNFMDRSADPAMETAPLPRPVPRWLPASSQLVLGGLVVWLVFTTAGTPTRANYTTTRAIVKSWAGEHDAAYTQFKQALAYDTFGAYEIRNRYAQYIIEYAGSRKIDDKLAERLMTAIESEKKNIREPHTDYLPFLYISRAHILLGKSDPQSPHNDLALANGLEALKVSPTFVRTLYEVAQAYLNKKDYPNAIKYFQKAVDLNPRVPLSWWYLGLTQTESGDKAAGFPNVQEAMKRGYEYQRSQADLLRLVQIFVPLNNFEALEELYGHLVKLAPKNPQYHASWALALSKLGKIDEAVAEARLAASLDSKFEADARQFVAGLGRRW